MPNEYPAQPRAAVGAIVFKNEKVLLVKRGQPPSEGLWAIPGGSVKLGETLQEAAEREIQEETGIIIRATEPVFIFDAIQKDEKGQIRFHYVIVDLKADYIEGEPQGRSDAVDARWVSPGELNRLNVNRTTRQLLKKEFDFGP